MEKMRFRLSSRSQFLDGCVIYPVNPSASYWWISKGLPLASGIHTTSYLWLSVSRKKGV